MTTTISPPSGVCHRFLPAAFEVDSGAEGKITAALSSEASVRTHLGDEILIHSRDAVSLDRAAKGLPLLIDHDHTRQLGRVVNIRLENKRLLGDLILSDRAEVAGIRADVLAGLRPDLSIGYSVDEVENGPNPGSYRATKWTLIEVSSVLVPADHSVGIGRSRSGGIFAMNTTTTPTPAATQQADDDARAERTRILDLQAMGQRLSIDPAQVSKAIEDGWSRRELAEQYSSSRTSTRAIRTAEGPRSVDDFEQAKGEFSMVRAIRDMVDGGKLTGREAEVSQELGRRNGGTAPKGVFIPTSALGQRTQLVGTANVGGNLVGDDFHPDKFIPPLRNASAIMQMGSTVLSDLVGNAIIPRQDNAAGGEWIAEDAEASETDLNFSQITLTPKTVSGRISWSRQAALQALPSMEQIVRQDLSAQLGLAIDLAAIAGTGSNNQPRGILNTSGIGSVPIGTNGGAPVHTHIVDLESAIADDNADTGNLGYLTNSKVRGKLKKTEKFSGTNGNPVWESGENPLNGYRAGVSNQVPSNLTKGTGVNLSPIIFGNWSELLIGLWGALDLIVDPYTFSSRGRVRISAFLSADIAVRHAESFAAIQDASTN